MSGRRQSDQPGPLRTSPASRGSVIDARVAGLEKDIDQLQDRVDQFNHDQKIEVDGRILALAS